MISDVLVLIFCSAFSYALVWLLYRTEVCFIFCPWGWEQHLSCHHGLSEPHTVQVQRRTRLVVRTDLASFVHSTTTVLFCLLTQKVCRQHLDFQQENLLLRHLCENQTWPTSQRSTFLKNENDSAHIISRVFFQSLAELVVILWKKSKSCLSGVDEGSASLVLGLDPRSMSKYWRLVGQH